MLSVWNSYSDACHLDLNKTGQRKEEWELARERAEGTIGSPEEHSVFKGQKQLGGMGNGEW